MPPANPHSLTESAAPPPQKKTITCALFACRRDFGSGHDFAGKPCKGRKAGCRWRRRRNPRMSIAWGTKMIVDFYLFLQEGVVPSFLPSVCVFASALPLPNSARLASLPTRFRASQSLRRPRDPSLCLLRFGFESFYCLSPPPPPPHGAPHLDPKSPFQISCLSRNDSSAILTFRGPEPPGSCKKSLFCNAAEWISTRQSTVQHSSVCKKASVQFHSNY